jgi:excisionase family DNA binding protein
MEKITVRTIGEVAEILKVGETVVYGLAQSGKLQGSKVGRQWRFTDEQIRAYLKNTVAKKKSRPTL